MLVDTTFGHMVCPNPCLSNGTAASSSAPALSGTQMGHSFWDGLLGAGTHTLALLRFPHLPHTWENTDLQIHLGSRPTDTGSDL